MGTHPTTKTPYILSIIKSSHNYIYQLRTPATSHRGSIPESQIHVPFLFRAFGQITHRHVLVHIISTFTELQGMNDHFRLCPFDSIQSDISKLDEKLMSHSFKFGVGFIGQGQTTEAEMLSNQWDDTTPEFKDFLNILGQSIRLKGWSKYRGGLDVRNDLSGTTSVYTEWKGYDIMFHVAPLLPHSTTDTQQLEKKRHVGNDVVVILYQDTASTSDDVSGFKLSTLRSKQNHVVFLVHPVKTEETTAYSLTILSKKEVGEFLPQVPEPCLLRNDDASREFLFQKLVNAERSCHCVPIFANKLKKTRELLLQEIIDTYQK
jgi:RAP1 GTPase activating protein 1